MIYVYVQSEDNPIQVVNVNVYTLLPSQAGSGLIVITGIRGAPQASVTKGGTGTTAAETHCTVDPSLGGTIGATALTTDIN
jgi:hypothetical protein